MDAWRAIDQVRCDILRVESWHSLDIRSAQHDIERAVKKLRALKARAELVDRQNAESAP
jgi:hypothetical protein